MKTDNFDRLELRYETPQLNSHTVSFGGEKALVLDIDGYISGGEYGSPSIPVKTDIVTVPFCSSFSVEVTDAVYDTVSLGNDGIMPLQPSRSKSQLEEPAPIVNSQRYATDEFWGMPLFRIEDLGIARDRRYASVVFSPVRVNPVSGMAIVCRQATVTVRYNDADVQGTIDYLNRYYSPAFTVGKTLNELVSTKDISKVAPLHMVIVSRRNLLCKGLTDFANWKRKQGMLVDLLVTDDEGLANNTAIANRLKNFYDSATTENPAPTFLVIVGDHTSIRAFDSRITSSSWWEDFDHISDLYYVSWTSNDDLPDCYLGRFSATDTNTVNNIVSKTLLYETYSFTDDSYLSRAVLVSGVDGGGSSDNDNAYRYCDPTMDYIAHHYVNADNGYNDITYYKNNPSQHPDDVTVTGSSTASSTASALRNIYNTGIGWINYSAHGNWNEWSIPAFTVTQVNNMTNNGKPSVMIGNCCLSNKFDKNVCFGESLLRRPNNAGAVVYFGATNSTYWSEDFYWSVGIRTNIRNNMNVAYNSSRLGMYDRLFHTHDEALSVYAITAGSMLVAGNMAVNAATSSQLSSSQSKLYYWEIYELMGDPSLLPWLGTAEPFAASMVRHNDDVTVTAPAHSYVAIVDTADYSLVSAAFADASGIVTLPVTVDKDLSSSTLSITAQGYRPFLKSINEMNVGVATVDAAATTVSPNPATDFCAVSAEGLRYVEVLDLMGRRLANVVAADGHCQLSLSGLNGGIYLLRLHMEGGVAVKKLVVNK